MIVLGLGGILSDAACAVLKDGELLAAVEERKVARQVSPGVLPEAAIAALSNARYAEMVEQDYQDGVSRGVVHTPTVFVNGKPFIETFTFEEISKGIDQALAEALAQAR